MVDMPIAVVFPSHPLTELTLQMDHEVSKRIINKFSPRAAFLFAPQGAVNKGSHVCRNSVAWIGFVSFPVPRVLLRPVVGIPRQSLTSRPSAIQSHTFCALTAVFLTDIRTDKAHRANRAVCRDAF